MYSTLNLSSQQVNERIIQMMSAEKSPIKLVFATVALGMGSDLRFVERVYHAGVPSSLEGIYFHFINSCIKHT